MTFTYRHTVMTNAATSSDEGRFGGVLGLMIAISC
jgi:hypothetical protein